MLCVIILKIQNLKNLIDNGYFWIKFKSGINGTYWISKSVPGNRNGLKLNIVGEKKKRCVAAK